MLLFICIYKIGLKKKKKKKKQSKAGKDIPNLADHCMLNLIWKSNGKWRTRDSLKCLETASQNG